MSSASYIRSGLVRRGLPEHVADAFMANFRDESGLNPGINEARPIVPGSRGGFGLYQLTGPRRREYEAFASKRGVPAADVDAQLDFMMGELSGSEKRAGDRILSAPDTASAAQAIVNDFLRPSPEHRARRAASYAGLGGGAPAAPSPLTAAMADRGSGGAPTLAGNAGNDTLAPTGAPSMAGPTVNIGLPNERRTKVQEALLQRALQGGQNIRHPLELVGNLAQVWAANRGLQKGEEQEASGIRAALANANLDPEFNLVAQLTGGREGLAQAILGQQEARTAAATRAEARADRQETQDYQRSQDALANERADATLRLQTEKANAPADPPSSVREYEYARTQGFTGTFAEWEQQNRRAGATVVNTGQDEGEFQKKAAGRMVERFGTIADGGVPAANTMQTIPVMRELLAQAPTGPIAGALAERFPGFSTAGDAFQATVNQIAPTLRIPGSGAMSDRDMDILLGSFPRLRSDPNANQIIMDVFERKAQVNHQRSQIASAALRGEIEPASADQQLAELDRVSILDDRTRALLSGNPSQSAAPAAPATSAPVDYRTKYGLE